MKYNVGDRVRIKNFDWFRNEGANMVVVYMTKYYGEVVTIKSINNGFYRIKEDGGQYCWIDEMFECKMEEESKPELKFKVGDKVRIKSIHWYNENKDADSCVHCGDRVFDNYMSVFCGSVVTIGGVSLYGYDIREDLHCRTWTDEMFEELVEEETQPKFKVGDRVITNKGYIGKFEGWVSDYQVRVLFEESGCNVVIHPKDLKLAEESDDFEKMYIESEKRYEEEYSKGEYCHKQSFKWGFQEGCDYAHENEKLEISLKDGYQFKDENGNVINATKIVLEKKKKEYPKTFLECCDVLNIGNLIERGVKGYKAELFDTLQKLLICRDAYWKIAGNELGLDKPWEPDWREERYIIYRNQDGIIGGYREAGCVEHHIFEFPIIEMRDAFKENFDPDIEICKEFL